MSFLVLNYDMKTTIVDKCTTTSDILLVFKLYIGPQCAHRVMVHFSPVTISHCNKIIFSVSLFRLSANHWFGI